MYEEEDIQYAIGKKLVTEAGDPGKKTVKGIEKYLKELEAEKQQILMNNQGGRMMKK